MNHKIRRNVSLDLIRIIASLAVIMIHASAWFATTYDTSSPEFFWGNIFDAISHLGVPLFIMISGALMLDERKELSTQKLLSKIKNIVILFLFWSAFYVLTEGIIYPLSKGATLNPKTILISLIEGYYHMWYLYLLVGLYLITPILRSFVSHANQNIVLLFIVLALLTQFTLPIINGLSAIWEPIGYITKLKLPTPIGVMNLEKSIL